MKHSTFAKSLYLQVFLTSFYRRSRRDATVNAIYEILTAKYGKCRHRDFKNISTVRFTVKSSHCMREPPTDDRREAFRHQSLTAENPRN